MKCILSSNRNFQGDIASRSRKKCVGFESCGMDLFQSLKCQHAHQNCVSWRVFFFTSWRQTRSFFRSWPKKEKSYIYSPALTTHKIWILKNLDASKTFPNEFPGCTVVLKMKFLAPRWKSVVNMNYLKSFETKTNFPTSVN